MYVLLVLQSVYLKWWLILVKSPQLKSHVESCIKLTLRSEQCTTRNYYNCETVLRRNGMCNVRRAMPCPSILIGQHVCLIQSKRLDTTHCTARSFSQSHEVHSNLCLFRYRSVVIAGFHLTSTSISLEFSSAERQVFNKIVVKH